MPRTTPEDSISFWRRRLAGAPPVLDLAVARPRRRTQPYAFGEATTVLPRSPGESSALEWRLLAALLVVLDRYCAQEDLVVGVDRGVFQSEGDFDGDLVPLRVNLAGDPTGSTLIGRIAEAVATTRPHHTMSFSQVLEAADVERADSHHPLVQVVFSKVAVATSQWPAPDVEAGVAPDLGLQLVTGSGEALARLVFNTELFDEATIGRLMNHLGAAFRSISETPGRRLRRQPLVSRDEADQITREWNATRVEFPSDRCLHHLFEDRVDEAPDALAVICDDDSLTYAELEQRSNRLARYLRARGVGPNELVGICVERSLEMVVGLMGIAKAGGAYMPLDPAYPADRLSWMLRDAELSVALTIDQLTDRLPETDAQLVRLDTDWEAIEAMAAARSDSGATSEDLAYVIYTSGSTGDPKGVVLNHRGRVNNFTDFNRRFSVGAGDRLIALSSLSFDMTAYDVFGILAAGATVVMPSARFEREPSHWAHLIRRHGVTIWHSAPAMLEMLVDNVSGRADLHPQSLRLCLLGGDWIPVNLPDRLREMAEDVQVISLGGATEASMDSTIYEVTRTDPTWTSIPYGRPMVNQLAYVLDHALHPQPIGVPGELHLGGDGVARGYLERARLTADKFIPNPFSGVPGDRMYRTGDLARYLDDGNLELLGRIDNQIKIRGHRIELGEIEASLRDHRAVREAVVVAKGDRGSNKKLVGYVVPELSSGDDGEGLEWDQEQVGEWRAVYDETYALEAEQADPTFNIIGWNSSYSGLPIPDEEMREWVDATVDRIRSLRPKRVLEIGCGSGLMLFRVAPQCERYVGTDLSSVGLESIRRQLGPRGLDQVELRHLIADDFSGLEPRSFDVVILNSITQLFPSVAYLLAVLEGAVETIRPGGFLFVGDNRDLRLAETLHASIQLFQAPASVPRTDLPERIAQSMAQEEQLLIDPELFRVLPSRLPRVSSTTVQIKRGRHHNELSRFRYDVIAEIEAEAPEELDAREEPETSRRDWRGDDLDLDAVRALLASGPQRLEVSAVPNARLAADLRAQALVSDASGPDTAGAIREALRDDALVGGIDPESFWQLAEEADYEAFIGHSPDAPGSFDAIFRKAGSESGPPALPAEPAPPKQWQAYGNQPLKGRLNLRLPGQLKDFLKQRLPDYMVPSTMILLDRLPLSPNGKVDRKSLPEPEQTRPELDAPLVPARNALEQVLTSIWEETLGLERIGVHDGFLELGGHSLLATQIQSRIHELFPVEIPLRHFFGALTIEGLAETLRAAAAATDVDIEASAELVVQYSGLSVEDLEMLLASESDSELETTESGATES